MKKKANVAYAYFKAQELALIYPHQDMATSDVINNNKHYHNKGLVIDKQLFHNTGGSSRDWANVPIELPPYFKYEDSFHEPHVRGSRAIYKDKTCYIGSVLDAKTIR